MSVAIPLFFENHIQYAIDAPKMLNIPDHKNVCFVFVTNKYPMQHPIISLVAINLALLGK